MQHYSSVQNNKQSGDIIINDVDLDQSESHFPHNVQQPSSYSNSNRRVEVQKLSYTQQKMIENLRNNQFQLSEKDDEERDYMQANIHFMKKMKNREQYQNEHFMRVRCQ